MWTCIALAFGGALALPEPPRLDAQPWTLETSNGITIAVSDLGVWKLQPSGSERLSDRSDFVWAGFYEGESAALTGAGVLTTFGGSPDRSLREDLAGRLPIRDTVRWNGSTWGPGPPSPGPTLGTWLLPDERWLLLQDSRPPKLHLHGRDGARLSSHELLTDPQSDPRHQVVVTRLGVLTAHRGQITLHDLQTLAPRWSSPGVLGPEPHLSEDGTMLVFAEQGTAFSLEDGEPMDTVSGCSHAGEKWQCTGLQGITTPNVLTRKRSAPSLCGFEIEGAFLTGPGLQRSDLGRVSNRGVSQSTAAALCGGVPPRAMVLAFGEQPAPLGRIALDPLDRGALVLWAGQRFWCPWKGAPRSVDADLIDRNGQLVGRSGVETIDGSSPVARGPRFVMPRHEDDVYRRGVRTQDGRWLDNTAALLDGPGELQAKVIDNGIEVTVTDGWAVPRVRLLDPSQGALYPGPVEVVQNGTTHLRYLLSGLEIGTKATVVIEGGREPVELQVPVQGLVVEHSLHNRSGRPMEVFGQPGPSVPTLASGAPMPVNETVRVHVGTQDFMQWVEPQLP